MKGKRFFVLASAAALALLFAGCGQQGGTGGGGTGDGAVTSVGIAPTYNNGVLSGIAQVKITVNEGARIQRIVLKVDGQEVSRITSQGLRPQAVEYTLTFDTAAYDQNTLQPRFLNGQRTLSAEVTDVQGNTKTASIQATFQNQDRVVGLTVSQTDNPKAPVTVGNTKWYGNGNVTVSVGIVSYSGATYSLTTASPNNFNLVASGGTTGKLSGYKVEVTATAASGSPVTGQPAVLFAKSANSGVSEQPVTVEVKDNNNVVVVNTSFGLDNVAPNLSSATVQLRRPLLNKNFAALSGTQSLAGSTLFRGSGATDTGGVGGITYKVRFNIGSNNIDKDLPDAPSAGVTLASLGLTAGVPYGVGIIGATDALGNAATQSFTSIGTVQQEDRTLTVNANFGPGGTANTFNITSINVSGNPVGSVTYYVLIPAASGKFVLVQTSTSNIPVANGARYRLLAVDQAGNFGFVDQPSGVSYSTGSTDTTPPSVTVTLPSTPVNNATNFTVSGTASDNVALQGPGVGIYLLQAVAGGVEYYLDGPTTATVGSNNQYTANNVSAPNYAGTLGVVVGAIDTGGNAAFATGTVQVK